CRAVDTVLVSFGAKRHLFNFSLVSFFVFHFFFFLLLTSCFVCAWG
ncbi:unnamed protein product, partial [Ixodes persulcatus]